MENNSEVNGKEHCWILDFKVLPCSEIMLVAQALLSPCGIHQGMRGSSSYAALQLFVQSFGLLNRPFPSSCILGKKMRLYNSLCRVLAFSTNPFHLLVSWARKCGSITLCAEF
jgi:hypothetical protein